MLHRALRQAGASEEADILEPRARRQARHDIVPHVLPVVHENALQKWEFRQQLNLNNCQGFRRFPTTFDSNVLKLPVLCLHEIEDGKIKRWHEFWNMPDFMSQLPKSWIEARAQEAAD